MEIRKVKDRFNVYRAELSFGELQQIMAACENTPGVVTDEMAANIKWYLEKGELPGPGEDTPENGAGDKPDDDDGEDGRDDEDGGPDIDGAGDSDERPDFATDDVSAEADALVGNPDDNAGSRLMRGGKPAADTGDDALIGLDGEDDSSLDGLDDSDSNPADNE